MGRSRRVRRARAFAPGHLTGFFVPEPGARDPRGRGSTGVGLVLDRGVVAEARFDPSGPTCLRLWSRPRSPLPISREVAQRLRAGIPGTLEIDLVHRLPIGQGLGMSAAGAVATGLAVASALDLPARRAWETAHLAEIYHQGGLGGVAAIGGGGLEQRVEAGLPPIGVVRHRRCSLVLQLLVVGPHIPTPSVLSDPARVARLHRAGRRSMNAYNVRPGAEAFLEESERFTDAAGLSSPKVTEVLRAARSAGYFAAQAMFGQVVFAVARTRGTGARAPPLPDVHGQLTLHVGASGAGLLDPRGD